MKSCCYFYGVGEKTALFKTFFGPKKRACDFCAKKVAKKIPIFRYFLKK